MDEIDKIKTRAKKHLKSNRRLIDVLKKKDNLTVDTLLHEAHEKAFSCIDCLQCANCCKTTGPLFTKKDIERIAKHLRQKPGDFVQQYLKIDEDRDYVLKSVPCTFLGADNFCSIYDVRPKACQEYPHTDRVKQKQILNLNLKNVEICPAVEKVFEEVRGKLNLPTKLT